MTLEQGPKEIRVASNAPAITESQEAMGSSRFAMAWQADLKRAGIEGGSTGADKPEQGGLRAAIGRELGKLGRLVGIGGKP